MAVSSVLCRAVESVRIWASRGSVFRPVDFGKLGQCDSMK